MSIRDLHNKVTVKRALSPASVADNTAQVSQIIDTQGYSAVEFVISTGTLADADATFAVLLEDGDNSSLTDNATVVAAQVLGTQTLGIQFDSDDKVFRLGYVGNKRYLRLTITPSANTSGALFSAVALLGFPHSLPAA